MNTAQKEVGNIRLYACGGAGTNIGIRLARLQNGQREVGFGSMDVAIIDTSKSNLRDGIPVKDVYLIDGLDGSGKIRADNYQEISSRVRDILQQYKPGDLNIVISSAAGGSGSVIAPSLVSELLQREVPTIVVTIGSADTRIDADNTLKTLKSYEAVAKLRNAPVVMAYFQNSTHNPRAAVDKDIEGMVISLLALFSRENAELDSRDLFNWLRFDRATSFGPQLAALHVTSGDDEMSDPGHIISVATLATEGGDTKFDRMPEYQCVGYLPTAAKDHVLRKAPVHFIVSDGIFDDVASELNKTLRELEELRAARIGKKGLLNNNDQATDTGLVL